MTYDKGIQAFYQMLLDANGGVEKASYQFGDKDSLQAFKKLIKGNKHITSMNHIHHGEVVLWFTK